MSQKVEYYAALKGVQINERSGAADKKALKQERAEKLKQSTAAAAAAKRAECNPEVDRFGIHPMIRSTGAPTTRNYVDVRNLNASLADKEVWVRARVQNVRGKGKAAFAVLRQGFSTVQLTVFAGYNDITNQDVKFIASIPRESFVDVLAVVVRPQEPIASCTQQDIELSARRVYSISSAEPLPFNVEDAARPDEEEYQHGSAVMPQATQQQSAEQQQAVRVLQDTRLDYRWIDLRTPANQAIYRVQSMVGLLFREFLVMNGFIEIHTPKLIGAASEGGASVFKLNYFDRPAFLAQSPQFYKQTAICADFDRVFEIGSVFRAENSNTHRHLCEFIGLDMEMSFKEHYYEALDFIQNMFVYIFDGLASRCADEIKTISQQFPCQPIRYRKDTLRFTYSEGIRLLNEAGENLKETDDINTTQEKKLGGIVAEKYGVDFFVMDKFPADVRPFYTMLDAKDSRFTNSYDAFLRGEEILSGAQRIHDPEMLVQRLREKKVDPVSVASYVDAFRHGAPPHAGCGVGLERVVMLYLGLGNIRRTSMFPRDPRRLTP